MAFDPSEFQRIAHQIADSRDEAALRTAVGRLYYSAFLKARGKLYPTGRIPRRRRRRQPHNRRGIHAIIVDDIKDRSWSLGTQLDELRWLRVQADYFLISEPAYRDWDRNWLSASMITKRLIPRLERDE